MNWQLFILKWHYGPYHHVSKNLIVFYGLLAIGFIAVIVLSALYFSARDLWKKTVKQRIYISNLFWYSIILFLFFGFVFGVIIDVGDLPITWLSIILLSIAVASWVVYKQIKRESKNGF